MAAEKENMAPVAKEEPSTPSTAAGTPAAVRTPTAQRAPLLDRVDRQLVLESEHVAEKRVTWEAFCVVLPVFMGYACLFSLQHQVKAAYAIADDMSARSRFYMFSVSLLYLGNLTFRVGHTLMARWLSPRQRVYLSLCSMVSAMTILGLVVFVLGSRWLGWVPIAYGLGGLSVGTFEANLLATLTPLPGAKQYAVAAIPVGITIVTIGAFVLLSLDVPIAAIYCGVAASCGCGLALWHKRIPDTTDQLQGHASLLQNAKEWRSWLPVTASLPIVFAIDMFFVSTFSPGVLLYVYDGPTVHLSLGAHWSADVDTSVYFALYDTATFAGGLLGRCGGYRIPMVHPAVFTPLSLFGGALIFSGSAAVQLIAGFFLLLGDGLVYSMTCRQIDARVPTQYAVVAMSLWLFIGDTGSVTGSNLTLVVRQLLLSA